MICFRSKVDFNRTFETSQDEEIRENIFWENLKSISHHNLKFRRDRVSFKLGINKLTDMTFDEYSNMYTPNETIKKLAKKLAEGIKFTPKILYDGKGDSDIPESFDWRDRGAVTGVKDQGTCGSCYAMATIGAVESQLFIESGKLVELSEQEIIDCAGLTYNSFGCAGGAAFRVFDYIKDKGISLAADYPYEEEAGTCRAAKKEKIPLKGYGFVLANKGDDVLLKALVNFGPLVVSIDIDHESFQKYSSGIYYEPTCTDKVNHGALLVGYSKDYYILKNSFGEKWGERGFFRIARNRGDACSINIAPLFPIMKEGKDTKEFVFQYSSKKDSLTLQKTNDL